MTRTIWIPEGLYRWLPRVALGEGAVGVLVSGESFAVLAVAMVAMAYGMVVLAARWSA